jgi:hypothetical protein
LSSPPANRCFSPTRASRTSPSGAKAARPRARREAPNRVRTARNASKPRRYAPSAEKKQPFRSSPHKGVRYIAANVSNSGGRSAHRVERRLRRTAGCVAGLKHAGLFAGRTETGGESRVLRDAPDNAGKLYLAGPFQRRIARRRKGPSHFWHVRCDKASLRLARYSGQLGGFGRA